MLTCYQTNSKLASIAVTAWLKKSKKEKHIPAVNGRETGYTLDTTQRQTRQPDTRSHSLLETITPTCMFLDSGRKSEYPERTHAYTGRTCKLHTGTLSLWGDGANHHTTVQPLVLYTTTLLGVFYGLNKRPILDDVIGELVGNSYYLVVLQ